MYKQHSENMSLHVARIIGCIAVVAIHSVSINASLSIAKNTYEWWVQTIVIASSIWAVPFFVMLSGGLLLAKDKKESIKTFYRRRFMRIGIPVLFWIPFSIVFYHYISGDQLSLTAIGNKIAFGSFDHLYFLILILELYILTPILREIIKKITFKNILYLSLLFFFIGFFSRRQSFTIDMFIPYIGYYLWGYYVIHGKIKKIFIKNAAALFTITIFLYILILYILTGIYPKPHIKDTIFYSHSNLLIIVLATSLLIFLQHSHVVHIFLKRIKPSIIKNLSSATLGIYIVHPFLQILTMKMIETYLHISFLSWYLMLLFIPYSLLISYFVVRVIKSVPYLKRVV